jgi:prepilin-type N-terminal cleavage/methylation domain-containing protein
MQHHRQRQFDSGHVCDELIGGAGVTFRTKKRKGFTLTEIAIVLAIVGLVLGAIWVAAKSVMDSNRATQAVQDISTMAANMRSTFLAVNSFSQSGDQTAAMITAGIIPNNLLNSNGTPLAKNAWGGAVKITLQPSGVPTPPGSARAFRISYLDTPPDACFRIASQLANLGTSDAPIDLITNGGSPIAIPNSGGTVGLSTGTISTACASNKGSGSASTEFDYTIH